MLMRASLGPFYRSTLPTIIRPLLLTANVFTLKFKTGHKTAHLESASSHIPQPHKCTKWWFDNKNPHLWLCFSHTEQTNSMFCPLLRILAETLVQKWQSRLGGQH